MLSFMQFIFEMHGFIDGLGDINIDDGTGLKDSTSDCGVILHFHVESSKTRSIHPLHLYKHTNTNRGEHPNSHIRKGNIFPSRFHIRYGAVVGIKGNRNKTEKAIQYPENPATAGYRISGRISGRANTESGYAGYPVNGHIRPDNIR